MPWRWEAMGVAELGVAAPQLPGLAVHEPYEIFLAPSQTFGYGHAGVISRIQKSTLQKGFQGQHFSWLQVNTGALCGSSVGAGL